MKPHAEIEQVWPRDGRIRIVGRLYGRRGDSGRDWRLLLVRRSSTQQLRYRARVEDDRFESEVPVADLAAYDTDGIEQWDLHLTDGEVKLRAGRQLDDNRDKKKIMVYPAQRVPAARGTLTVQPYYTVQDNLSLECRV
ncbi:hypothetical protein [Streptomyces himalayensis]|uniref:Uncharacterized protein n=1 Tax=Streptomyces himalayensis subsp. himalayensis TaxID=2756131 RepID=A0A7W0DMX7_9ACTN|nr:hypothetical protein [Streptomyces himalayensis]MBA2947593.1 hypothetical protein [Streptomyces himalayensis subsp. himalayensis]